MGITGFIVCDRDNIKQEKRKIKKFFRKLHIFVQFLFVFGEWSEAVTDAKEEYGGKKKAYLQRKNLLYEVSL